MIALSGERITRGYVELFIQDLEVYAGEREGLSWGIGKSKCEISSALPTKEPSAFALSVARRSVIFSETTFAARPGEASASSPSASSISSS